MEKITIKAIKSFIIAIGITVFIGFVFSNINYFWGREEISEKVYYENIKNIDVINRVVKKEEFNYKAGLISGALSLLFFMFVFYDEHNKKKLTTLLNVFLNNKIDFIKKNILNTKNVMINSKFKKIEEEKNYNTNKHIELNNQNKKLLLEIYAKNPLWFIDLIALNYPLNEKLIERYTNLDWNYLLRKKDIMPDNNVIKKDENYMWHNLSRNLFLPWSMELIKKYKKNWNWHYLSKNESIKWSNELIEIYNDKWDWNIAYKNKSEIFHNEINIKLIQDVKDEKITIEQFLKNIGDRWKEEYYGQLKSLETINTPPVTLSLAQTVNINNYSLIEEEEDRDTDVEKGKNQYDIPDLSIDFSKEDTEKIESVLENNEKIYLKILDKFLPSFSIAIGGENIDPVFLLEEFINISTPKELEYISVSTGGYIRACKKRGITVTDSQSQQINKMAKANFSPDLLSAYHSIFETVLIENKVTPATEDDTLSEQVNEIDWYALSKNDTLFWSIEFIEKHKDKWDWKELTYNKSIPWTLELIVKYSENITKVEINWKIINSFINDDIVDVIFEMTSKK